MSDAPSDDERIRRVLHDAVSDVQPRGTLDDIRSRTEKVVPMKRWFLPTIAVAAVMAAVVGGAFWLASDDDPARGPSTQPSTTVSTSPEEPTSSSAPHQERAVPVYFVGETAHGKKLFREFQRASVSPGGMAKASVDLALAGDPIDSDYTNPWSGLATDDRWTAEYDDTMITISLPARYHDRPSGMSSADAELAVQQLVYSAQAGLGKGRVPVQLLIDDKHTDTVLGVPAAEPLAAASPDEVLAPVQIDSPEDGATVGGTFTVTGRAAAFEANVLWELKQGDTVVKHGNTTAQECCILAPYSFEVTAPPGDYTLVVHDEDMSGEGRPVNEDTKEITVK